MIKIIPVIEMELLDVMLERRSTRKFNDEPISKSELDKILAAALLAPTSMNRKPCNFMVVERKETLEELSRSKDHGADLIKGADKAVVVIADTLIADTWIEDSSIALTYMHLMATELGLGSCWVQIHMRSRDGVDSEGMLSIYDPNSPERTAKKWDIEQVIVQIDALWGYAYYSE